MRISIILRIIFIFILLLIFFLVLNPKNKKIIRRFIKKFINLLN